MKKLIIIFIYGTLSYSSASAQINFLTLPNGTKFAANFPCAAQPSSATAAGGRVNALRCSVQSSDSACTFMITEQSLDMQEFNKTGFAFIAEIHRQYAKQMDPNFVPKLQKITTQNGLGKVLDYELHRSDRGYVFTVKGKWLTTENRMLRANYSCTPTTTNFMTSERGLFLNSLTLIK